MSVPTPPEDYTYPEDYVPPPPFPSPVSSMTLHITKGTPPNEVTYTESIPYASFGENSIAITNQQLIDDFSNKPPGTKYSYHITTNFVPGSFPTGDVVTTPTVTNQTVKATPSLYANYITYNPVTEDRYVSQCCSTSSSGSLTYTTGDENVCTIETGTGKILAVGTGTTELVCSQTSNSEYEGETTSETIIVSYPRSTTPTVTLVPLVRLLNGITISYTGNPGNIPAVVPLFFQENIRRTGTREWFAVVDNRHRQLISNYANGNSTPFTPPGQSTPVPFNNIVTTHVTNMAGLFQGATAFNSDISSWDTSRVESMAGMFNGATAFNRPLNSWNTSRVIDMSSMFANAIAFNEELDSWGTSRVVTMSLMFQNATMFDQPLNSWNTSSVFDMGGMFSGATAFNRPLILWNTSQVFNMIFMFASATAFNQELSRWNTNNVRVMTAMFQNATNFNNGFPNGFPPGSAFFINRLWWNVSNVTRDGLNFMFNGASVFNANISHWNAVNVNSSNPAIGFRRNSPLIDLFTPLAIRDATGGGI